MLTSKLTSTRTFKQRSLMSHRIVIALGGNAFHQPGEPLTMAGQFRYAEQLAERLVPLFKTETQVVITHGNGPQVGHLLTRVEQSLGRAYAVPLEVCVAESEGELGYVLEQALYNALREAGVTRPLVSVLTQVVVDAADPAFTHPTKPIGSFYTAAQADELRARGFTVHEDAGRGYRRVVPSPRPLRVVETDIIDRLLDFGAVVIGGGGGGIPVIEQEGRLCGVQAVVDKDLTSALLAEALGASTLLILTGVPCAYRDYGTPQQAAIGRITPDAAQELLDQGHFPAGSMGPKIEAAIRFSRGAGRRTIICDPSTAVPALRGHAGTIVTEDVADDDVC